MSAEWHINLSFMCEKSQPNLAASMGLHDLRVDLGLTLIVSILLIDGKMKFMLMVAGFGSTYLTWLIFAAALL